MSDYQCVLASDGLTWHATQEQAAPPPITRGGAYTTCAVWCEFRRGYERRRPTCPECLRACEQDEARRARKPSVIAQVAAQVMATVARKPRRLGG